MNDKSDASHAIASLLSFVTTRTKTDAANGLLALIQP